MKCPMVSIFMVTYNHEMYIAQAIESVLNQITKFEYILIIGEDYSTDRTRNICLDYAREYPKKIKLILNKKNLGSSQMALRVYNACVNNGSKYTAMLEGDDYWTDSNKLQKQIDYLEKHEEAVGCFHNSILVNENGGLIDPQYFKPEQKQYTQKDVIDKLLSRYATSSLLFRSKVFENGLPEWFMKSISDYSLDILISQYGELHYLDLNMSAYRIHGKGLWQGERVVHNELYHLKRLLIIFGSGKFEKFEKLFKKKILKQSKRVLNNHQDELTFFRLVQLNYFIYKYSPEMSYKLFVYKLLRQSRDRLIQNFEFALRKR